MRYMCANAGEDLVSESPHEAKESLPQIARGLLRTGYVTCR